MTRTSLFLMPKNKFQFTFALFISLVYLGQAQPVDKETLLATLIARQNTIHALFGQFTLHTSMQWKDSAVISFEKKYTWHWFEGKHKIIEEWISVPDIMTLEQKEGLKPVAEPIIHYTDGAVYKKYLPKRKLGFVRKAQEFWEIKKPVDWLFPAIGEKDLVKEFLSQPRTVVLFKGLSHREEQEIRQFEFQTGDWQGELELVLFKTVWLPFRLCARRHEVSLGYTSKIVYSYQNFKEYNSVPLATKVETVLLRERDNSVEKVRTETFVIQECQINQNIDEKEMVFDFPPGVFVSDALNGRSYVVEEEKKEQ